MNGIVQSQRKPIDFSGDSNADLLGYIALRHEDEASAREAHSEFFARHGRWLAQAAHGRFRQSLAESAVDDLVQDVMLRVWERAETFKATTSEIDSDRRAVRAWIGQIANRIVVSAFRSTDVVVSAQSLSDDMKPRDDSTVEGSESPAVRIAREELDRLSEREKDVMFEWLLHLKPDAAHQRLPNEVSQQLAARWSTTPENIRQIRSRTIRDLKDRIASRTGRLP